ncbi:epidermal growth factor receptor-like isoform X2 [Oscarella lobularis]|uniref:epidermal growth factor receptor-like isoform X2 n=1 Tax=Oscarella lobularis TaxID=121494 RepID=UPI003313350B
MPRTRTRESSFSLAPIVVLFCLLAIPVRSVAPRTCRGTNYGTTIRLHGSTPDQRLARLRTRLDGCVVVDGNVELVGLAADAAASLNLSTIEVISGYLLVYRTDLTKVDLPSLKLVRGERLFVDRLSSQNASAALAVIDNPALVELNLGALVEVSTGAALFRNNSRLCYVDTIRWDDILEGNGTNFGLNSSGCSPCPSCNGSRCWSPGVCQRPLSKVVCPPSCSSRCAPNAMSVLDCCHEECAAGCVGPSSDRFCEECKNSKDSDGLTCRAGCQPSELDFVGTRLCIAPAECPAHLLQPNRPVPSCSPDCQEDTIINEVDMFNEKTGMCELCSSPCVPPTKCAGVEQVGPVLHKGNIASFAGCSIVEGSIHIDRVSFTGDALAGIEALTFDDLVTALADVTAINGYLAITDVDDPAFTDLSFLPKLRAIRGRFTPYVNSWSLYINDNAHLVSLQTASLERIDRGNVSIDGNNRLCFIDSINWTQILRDPESALVVRANQDNNTCHTQGNICDVECSGCWGAGPEQCQNCQNFAYDELSTGIRICVSECNLAPDGKTCRPCPNVCARLCKGPTSRDCVSDGPPGSECKNRIHLGECLLPCPVGLYGAADNKTCLPCNSSCEINPNPPTGLPIGCTGPKAVQGPGGCDRCQKIWDPEASEYQCVESGVTCPSGRFDGPVTAGLQQSVPACRHCQDGCLECSNLGLQFPLVCQKCAKFVEDGSCVPSCSVGTHYADGTMCSRCHPECNNCSLATRRCGCTGPADTDCNGCFNSRERILVTLSVRPTSARLITTQVPTTTTTRFPTTVPTVQCNETRNETACNRTTSTPTTTTTAALRTTTRPPMRPTRSRVEALTRCIPACPSEKPLLDFDTFCVAECSPGYYNPDEMTTCQRCDLQCDDSASCTGPSASDCDRCKTQTLIELDGNTTCVDECPVRFDVRLIDNRTCERYNGTEAPTNRTRTTPEPEKKAPTVGIAVGGGIGGVVLIALILILVYVVHSHLQAEPKLEALLLELAELPDEYRTGEAKLEIIDIKALEFGNKLGSGTFGEVFKGFWHPEGKTLKIPVGIKILDQTLELKEEKDILQEVVLLSAISSSDVLRILGLCMNEEDKSIMLVSHYCPFGSLVHFLKRQRRYLTSTAVLTYSWQIAKGMEFLSVKGIVHGNLACRNVLVQKPNQVRITDYGTSKLADNIGSRMLLPWMAPETIQKDDFTTESDVWSYGVTLWEIMTFGGVPYRDKSGEDILAVLQTGERLRQPKTVTVEVYGLMLRCWLFDRTARVDFSELVVDLENLKKDPSRYVIVSKADELDKDDRAEQMRRYADTLGADDDYELDFDPEAEKALYEDPDAEGFFHYEDPDKLKNGSTVPETNENENPYDNDGGVPQSGSAAVPDDDGIGYENPLQSPKKKAAADQPSNYENPHGANAKDGLFDEAAYESVPNSQGPSRVGSEQAPKYSVPPEIKEPDEAGYEDPSANGDMGEGGYQDPTEMHDDMDEGSGYQDPTEMQDMGEDYENPLGPVDDEGYQAVDRPEQ